MSLPMIAAAVTLAAASMLLGVSSPRVRLARLAGRRRDRAPTRPWQARPGAVTPPMRRLVALGAGGAVALFCSGLPWWGWLAAGAAAAGAAYVILGRVESSATVRRRGHLVADLPQSIELIASCLAAGMPLRQATEAVAEAFGGPIGQELSEVLARVAVGMSDAEAWAAMTAEPVLADLARDVAKAAGNGAALGELLRMHAGDAVRNHRSQLHKAAKTVGVRSVLPLMLCFLPAFLLIGIVPAIASAMLRLIAWP